MAVLNFRLAPSLKAGEIVPEIQKVVSQLAGTRGEQGDKLFENIQTSISKLR